MGKMREAFKRFCETDAAGPTGNYEFDLFSAGYQAALADAAPVIPEGMVMVPKEPTEKMCSVWQNWGGPDEKRYVLEKRNELYKAMIAAYEKEQK